MKHKMSDIVKWYEDIMLSRLGFGVNIINNVKYDKFKENDASIEIDRERDLIMVNFGAMLEWNFKKKIWEISNHVAQALNSDDETIVEYTIQELSKLYRIMKTKINNDLIK